VNFGGSGQMVMTPQANIDGSSPTVMTPQANIDGSSPTVMTKQEQVGSEDSIQTQSNTENIIKQQGKVKIQLPLPH